MDITEIPPRTGKKIKIKRKKNEQKKKKENNNARRSSTKET